jgi:nicotinate-nucleotide pyrophosphorylase (carboxylating)
MHFSPATTQLIALALAEDLAQGDITSTSVIPASLEVRAEVLIKAPGVLAGVDVAESVCAAVDPMLRWQPLAGNGQAVAPGDVVAIIEGGAREVLAVERTLLNFLQRLSGIATLTARYVAALAGTRARLVDTRKTTPGWRWLEKAAVRAGGGHNHRFNLGDGVLIKDNHLALARQDIGGAVAAARATAPHTLRVEVEVEDLAGVEAALAARADIILLDNMSLEAMRAAVDLAAGRALLEASGGITLERVRAVAETGVDLISCGAITHSATALDISLEAGPLS